MVLVGVADFVKFWFEFEARLAPRCPVIEEDEFALECIGVPDFAACVGEIELGKRHRELERDVHLGVFEEGRQFGVVAKIVGFTFIGCSGGGLFHSHWSSAGVTNETFGELGEVFLCDGDSFVLTKGHGA